MDGYARWMEANRFHALRTPLHDLPIYWSFDLPQQMFFDVYIYIYKLVLTFRIWTFPSMIELPHKNPLGEKQPARRWCLYCGIGLWHWQHMIEKNSEGGSQGSIEMRKYQLCAFMLDSPYWQPHEIVKQWKLLRRGQHLTKACWIMHFDIFFVHTKWTTSGIAFDILLTLALSSPDPREALTLCWLGFPCPLISPI